MATLIRCPRCKAETDASAAKPGSIIKCVHCRGDMRVPDAAKPSGPPQRGGGGGGGGGAGGGRQSTLFRRMNNATLPGQKGRTSGPAPTGPGRGASERGRDLSGLYIGGGIVGIIAIIIAIGVVMGGKKEEAVKGPPKKEVAKRAPVDAPPPPPPPPVEPEKPPDKRQSGPPASWEPDALNYVLASTKPINADSTAEKDGLHFIRSSNSDRIHAAPFRYMPFVINSLVSEDRDLARSSFQALYNFCEYRSLKNSDGKNPIDLTWVNDAEYRGYIYQWMLTWWSQSAHKLPDAPGNQAAVDRIDWVALTRQLMGGAYHDESTPQGTAYIKVKNMGQAAWPKLAEIIDHEELPVGRTAAQVLAELTKSMFTGDKIPLPNEQNRAEVKNAWLAWIAKNK